MIESLQGWLIAAGAGIVIGILFRFCQKKLPKIIGKWLDDRIDIFFALGGPAEDKLIYAIVEYAEYYFKKEFPSGGAGREKYKFVADKIISMLMPVLNFPVISILKKSVLSKSDKIAKIIEANVEKVKKTLKENMNEHRIAEEG